MPFTKEFPHWLIWNIPRLEKIPYNFEVYALDCFLDLDGKAKKEDLLKAMEGHTLQKGSIIGKYKR